MQDKAVHVIREELEKQGLNAVKIILFGSRARGDFRPDSDWDFLVVIDKDISFSEKKSLTAQVKRKLEIPNDVILKPLSSFQRDKDIVGNISFFAQREGIEL
jgi:predicted nucleotidyltransferase